MDKIKALKVKEPDGSLSENTYFIGIDATNVDMTNGENVQDTIGNIDFKADGSVKKQLEDLRKNIPNLENVENLSKKIDNNTKAITNIEGSLTPMRNDIDQLQKDMSKKVYYYNTVAEMKSDAQLKEGDMAITLGYYSANDGGGAEYKIVSGNKYTDDGGSYHKIKDELFAELIIKNDTVNVKQFGAKGDNQTFDTDAFLNAIKSAKIIEIPEVEDAYLVGVFAIRENKKVIGLSQNKVKINQLRGENPLGMAAIFANSSVENIYLNSLDESKQWNRWGLSGDNIIIKNCKIEGFRDNTNNNAWGLYLKNNNNVIIKDCIFENNSQSDIAIVDGNSNIIIENCTGSHMYINMEPNNVIINKNITIRDCNVWKISMLENNYTVRSLQDITIENCNIEVLMYRGGSGNLINNKIDSIKIPGGANHIYAGILHNINSYGYGKQINDDPFFYNITNHVDEVKSPNWSIKYSSTGENIRRIDDEIKGDVLQLNPNHYKSAMRIIKSFDIKPNTLYEIKTLMNTTNGESIHTGGHGLSIDYMTQDNTLIETKDICIDRNANINSENEWEEKTLFFLTPENAAYITITVSNTIPTTTDYSMTTWKYLLIREVNCTNKINNNLTLKDIKSYATSAPTTGINAVGFKFKRRTIIFTFE